MNKLIIACLLVLATFFAYAYETGQVGGKLMAGGGSDGKKLDECGLAKSSEPTNGGYADVDGMKLEEIWLNKPKLNLGVESGTKALYFTIIGPNKPKPSDEFGFKDVDGAYRDECRLAKSYDPEPEPFANVNFGVESGTKALYFTLIGPNKPRPDADIHFGVSMGGRPLYLTSVGSKPPKASLGIEVTGGGKALYLEDEHRQPKPYLEGQDGFKPTKIYLEESPIGGVNEHPWQDSG